jgi:plasmid stabilization system protein ParE
MGLEVVFSDVAIDMLISIGEFIENKWSPTQTNKFLEKVHKTIDLASKHPYMFKASSFKDNIRIGLVSKQTSFFYEIKENEIVILFFWDNRQDPMFNT